MTSKCEHIELSTDDPQRAKEFYASLFGWKIDALPDPAGGAPYLMFQTDTGGGGIAPKMSPQQPTAWMPYITVASVNASLATATKLGANTVLGHTPIGEMGAIAVITDPTGGTIGLWEPAAKRAPAKKAAPAKKSKPAAKKKPTAKKPAKKKR